MSWGKIWGWATLEAKLQATQAKYEANEAKKREKKIAPMGIWTRIIRLQGQSPNR